MDISRAPLKSKLSGRYIYGVPPLVAGWDSDTMWELLKPLYGLATACEECYGALRDFLMGVGVLVVVVVGGATLLDKSVIPRGKKSFSYGFGKGFMDEDILGITK